MTAIGGRPMTVIHPQMIDNALAVGGIIVARRSRCGRYMTYQVDTGPAAPAGAVLAADAEDVAAAVAAHGRLLAGPVLQSLIGMSGVVDHLR